MLRIYRKIAVESASFPVGSFLLMLISAILHLALLSGCSRSQDQVDFEKNAFRVPTDFTETAPNGDIIRKDDNDWIVGPMFRGYMEVHLPPFPNPTHGQSLEMEFFVTGSGTVDGLNLYVYDELDFFRPPRNIYRHDRTPLESGFLKVTIYPESLDRRGSYSAARQINEGLHRLFVYDNRFNLITYGDIKLE